MPHAHFTLFISVQCMDMFFFPSLPFRHRHAVAPCPPSFPFHGYAWCMPLPHATTHWNLLEHSSVDLIQTCTYKPSSIKGRKCQPENSSLVFLVFPLHSQRDLLQNRLLALSVCLFWFPRVPVDAVTFWVVSKPFPHKGTGGGSQGWQSILGPEQMRGHVLDELWWW